jgi:hypothetical protein
MLSGLTFGSKKDLEKQFREEAELDKAKKREDKKQQRKQKKVRLQAGTCCVGTHHAAAVRPC